MSPLAVLLLLIVIGVLLAYIKMDEKIKDGIIIGTVIGCLVWAYPYLKDFVMHLK